MHRFPAVLAGAAIAVKLAAIVFAESFPEAPMPLLRLVLQDAVSADAADAFVGWVFGNVCFPTLQMAVVFESALLAFTGLEWYVYGMLICAFISPGTAYSSRARASRRGTA